MIPTDPGMKLPIRNLSQYSINIVTPMPKVQLPERVAMRPGVRAKINAALDRIFGREYKLPLGQCYVDNLLGHIYVRPEDYADMAAAIGKQGE